MNLTNQELKNDGRNVEAAELVRDLQNPFRFTTENLFAALVLIDMFSSRANGTRIECAEVVGSTPTPSIFINLVN
jgi:hypothetical protein